MQKVGFPGVGLFSKNLVIQADLADVIEVSKSVSFIKPPYSALLIAAVRAMLSGPFQRKGKGYLERI